MIDERLLPEVIADAVRTGHKLLVCGNGGLAAESEHFAAELMGKFAFDVYLPCIALTSNSSLTTAISNDISFEEVFAHQVKGLGQKGDILIGMTTSWSKNILRAFQVAKQKGLMTILLCGYETEEFSSVTDYRIRAKDKTNTQTIQESILKSLHELAYEVKCAYRQSES